LAWFRSLRLINSVIEECLDRAMNSSEWFQIFLGDLVGKILIH